ncbi:MAG: HAMP domain-containing histidine kinase [Ignavibacteriales bacterium]|nr:HAMP domain-containing histidine kinase [Ignavibacteriales bacterium]
MFKNASLPIKVFLTFFPLFFTTVAIISYINYSTTQEEMMFQVQNAATAQANTIRESIVNMMITNERVEDSFLRKISSAGDIKNISILFKLDSLHLDEGYGKDTARIRRLSRRESAVWERHADIGTEIFSLHQPRWFLICSKHIHETRQITDLSRDKPTFIQTCEEMQALVPFAAEKKCTECHGVQEGAVLGAAVMNVPLDATAAHLGDNAERSLYIFFGFIALSLVVNAFVFRKFINTPLRRLLHAIDEIGKGKTNVIKEKFAGDEFGTLAVAFEQMEENLLQLKQEAMKNERLSALGQMASSIVHDFRNPMTNLTLAIEQLQNIDAISPERRERMFKILYDSIRRIDGMMQELLDYSSGASVLQYKQHDIDGIVLALNNEYGLLFQNSAIEFSVNNSCTGVIAIDKERFLRAIGNLINNAADAIAEKGKISVTMYEHDSIVVFSVLDNGKGIPKEIHETLFEPFVTYGKKKGTGLGLASVKRLVELHNGTISFTSEPGIGTEFIVNIPRNRTF